MKIVPELNSGEEMPGSNSFLFLTAKYVFLHKTIEPDATMG